MNISTIPARVVRKGSQAAARPARAPALLAAAGSMVVLATTFTPWYRVGASQLPRTAWQQNPFVLALLLLVVLAGAALATVSTRRAPMRRAQLVSVFCLSMIATIAVVLSLFIDRPSGAVVAFGGYPALLGINLVKLSAVVNLARTGRGR